MFHLHMHLTRCCCSGDTMETWLNGCNFIAGSAVDQPFANLTHSVETVDPFQSCCSTT